MNYHRRCIAINSPEYDFLRSELWKLKKKLTSLEINYEAKMKVYKNYNEEKKIIKLKKDFTIKRESIVEEQKIINERISKMDKEERLVEHTRHMREWEIIKEKVQNVPQFKKLLKLYVELEKEERYEAFGVPYSIFKYEAVEHGFHEVEFVKIIKYFQEDWDLTKALSYVRYTNTLRSRFSKEIEKL